ncbi:MAG: hypothetical protein ACUVTZ_01700 [Armatimonadota bacterium]
MILKPMFMRARGSHEPPERLGWRDWYQVATSVVGLLLGVAIAVRAVREEAYIALVGAAAFLGWGAVRLGYIWSYFRRRSAKQ